MILNLFILSLFIGVCYYFFIMGRHWFRQGYRHGDKDLDLDTPGPAPLARLAEPTGKETIPDTQSEQKGYEFEKFVVSLFNKPYFQLIDWRGDKKSGGVYALSSRYPDLRYEFKSKHRTVRFVVECKWRQSFFRGGVEWAKPYQLKTYHTFQKETGNKVYVALGIGGTPEKPADMYVFPLEAAHNFHFLYERFLREYKRPSPDQAFFLDPDTLKLA